jgi:hypothetical protein
MLCIYLTTFDILYTLLSLIKVYKVNKLVYNKLDYNKLDYNKVK